MPSGRPFTVADVRECARSADDDAVCEAGPANQLPSNINELEARTLRMLHTLPRSRHKELLQLVNYGRPSSAMPQLQTPADAKRLLGPCAASDVLGGVPPVPETCMINACTRR